MPLRNALHRPIAALLLCCIAIAAGAQYNDINCLKRPFTTRIVQIDQIDEGTLVYFEYHNDGQRYMNVSDQMAIHTESDGRTYKLLDSYNMPIADSTGTRQLVLDDPDEIYHFALMFEKVPDLNVTMDIIENEGNSRLLNFYDVSVNTKETSEPVDYDHFVTDSPLREYGTYAQDGEVIQYMARDGILMTVHTEKTSEYGKHFTVDINIQNYSDHTIAINPDAITATSILPKKTEPQPLKVLSANDYDKKIKRRQNWIKALVIAAEVAAVVAVGVAESKADRRHSHHSDVPSRKRFNPAPYHRYYSSYHRRHHPHHDAGGIATVATAAVGTAATEVMFDAHSQKRAELMSNYIMPTSLQPNQEYSAYFNIEQKKTDNFIVNIPIGKDNFSFRIQWQDGKKK